MIIVAHLVFLTLVYLGLPALSAALGDGGVVYTGGVFATITLAVSTEIIVIAMSLLALVVNRLIGINPLLQRRKAVMTAQSAIFVGLALFLNLLPSIVPGVLALAWYWVLIVPAFVCVGLEVMLSVKRRLIARSYR